MGRHTDREYEAELTQLRENLLLMGARVEQMVHQSIRALQGRDAELARATAELDREVNRLEIDTDDLCVRVLARRQPVGGDLRFVTSVLKLVTDLERMGDLCGNVCDHVVALSGVPPLAAESLLAPAGERVAEMIRDALDAFVHADPERARAVLENDRTLDAAYAALSEEILVSIEQRPETLRAALRVQAIGRALERTGDHATNVAERVVYLVSGVDIRHKGRKHVSVGTGPRGVLFVCSDNAARSQMAEGWARKLFRGGVKIFSAGASPAAALDPLAIEVMSEVGVDLARQAPKRLADVPLGDVDVVVRLSDDLLPAELRRIARVESWVLRDEAPEDGTAKATTYRELRDEIGRRVRALAMG
jgi:phosphate transport system protein